MGITMEEEKFVVVIHRQVSCAEKWIGHAKIKAVVFACPPIKIYQQKHKTLLTFCIKIYPKQKISDAE